MKSASPPRYPRHGMTLIELLIAITILAMVLFTIGQALFSTLEVRDHVEEVTRPNKIASRFMALLSSDLQAVFAYSTEELTLFETRYGSRVGGSSSRYDSIQFVATTTSRLPRGEIEAPVSEVGYEVLERDRQRVLFRREDFYVDDKPLQGGKRVRLVENVKLFKLEYRSWETEGRGEWVNRWDPVEKEDFPRAVRVELHFEVPASNEKGTRIAKFKTVIGIPSRPRVVEEEEGENGESGGVS